jgi:hydroxylamine reductase (hybrid-cluster protein)
MRLMTAMSGYLNRPLEGIPVTVILSFCDSSMAALFSLLYAGIRNIRLSPEFTAIISPGVMKILHERYGIEMAPG